MRRENTKTLRAYTVQKDGSYDRRRYQFLKKMLNATPRPLREKFYKRIRDL